MVFFLIVFFVLGFGSHQEAPRGSRDQAVLEFAFLSEQGRASTSHGVLSGNL